MHPLTFLIASLLFSRLTTSGRAETISYTLPDLQNHCSFDLNGYVYDLCPLIGSTKVVEVPKQKYARLPSDSGPYLLSLSGLGKEKYSGKRGCNEQTLVFLAQKIESTHDHGCRLVPIIQKGEDNLVLSVVDRGNHDHDAPQLKITFPGARYNLDVIFRCSEEVERVELIDVHYDTFQFMWTSQHGCPRNRTQRREPKFRLISSTTEGQEPNDDEQEGDDELFPSDSRKARMGIALVITFIVLSIICGSALALSTQARHFVAKLLWSASCAIVPFFAEVGMKLRSAGQSLTSKAISFRPNGDNNVVVWAQEDLTRDSDTLMNKSRPSRFDEENWDGLNEYIPLATSPKFGAGRRIQSYGSTLETEVAQERGVLSRMRRYLKL